MRLCIRAGRVIDPENNIDDIQDVYIADGKIVSVGQMPDGFTADKEIYANDQIVCPGLVDLCARLREPGLEHKATISSETQAAASSGITTICCPPDTQPIIDTPAVARHIRQRAEQEGKANVVTLGALTKSLAGEQLSEMAALKEAGCIGVSNTHFPVKDSLTMRRAMEYAATFDLTIFLHAEDVSLRNNGCVHEGTVSTRLGLPGIPEAAETVAVARDLALIAQTGVRAHFCRLSSAQSVRMIGRAKHDGLPVSADVCAHQLHLTEMDVVDFQAQCHLIPPLRTQRDRDALINGLKNSTVSAICSDHQPHEPDAKLNPFSMTEPGISGLETLLPLSLRMQNDDMNLMDIIDRLTRQPARILGINAGSLSPGTLADICIFNPDASWTLDRDSYISRGKNSPFHGWELTGQVNYTLLAGKLVFDSELDKSLSKQR